MASKTLKYVLIGGACAAGVYFVARAMKKDEPPKQPTTATAAGQIIGGVKDLWTSLKDRKAPSGSPMPPDNSPYSPGPMAGDGEAAISNAQGTVRSRTPMPDMPSGYRDRAIGGVVNYSAFGIAPARTRA